MRLGKHRIYRGSSGTKSWGTLLDILRSLGLRVMKSLPKANNWVRFAF